jgi:Tol biopolymer transport system component
MNPDGSNQKQITNSEGGPPIFISADSEWLYYHQSLSAKLWRVSLKSGEEQLVLDKAKSYYAISPDGLKVAFSERQGDERILTIASLADGQITKTFHLADKKLRLLNIVWMPDGKSLLYVTDNLENDDDGLWRQFLDEETPRQIITLKDGENIAENFSVSVSPDGKTIAFVQGKWLHDAVLLKGLK